MVPWRLENILTSCSYLRKYLLESENYSEEREKKLLQRTSELIMELNTLGLIENSYNREIAEILKDTMFCSVY